jgi:[ribosomal protein S18]-alanine N-acetyltransferase
MSGTRLAREAGRPRVEIARMTEHDLLEVVEIEETCGLSLWGWDAYRAELDRPEAVTLVARVFGGQGACAAVCGFVAARVAAGELHVNNIGVRREARRRGLGGLLLGRALDIARAGGAERAVLEVRKSNGVAQALYGRFGFEAVGERRNYYREPAEDALVMVRPLGGAS